MTDNLDTQEQSGPKHGVLATCGVLILSLIGFAAPMVFIIYMGLYTFSNPDKEAWVGLDTKGKQTMYPDQIAGIDARATELINIHETFYVWLLWGFI